LDDRWTLVVLSSDFCDWGARFDFTFLPQGDGQIYERIERMDREGAKQIASGDPKRFTGYLKATGNTICGRKCILIMMHLHSRIVAEFPAYSQSSRATKMSDSTVSYMAGIIRSDRLTHLYFAGSRMAALTTGMESHLPIRAGGIFHGLQGIGGRTRRPDLHLLRVLGVGLLDGRLVDRLSERSAANGSEYTDCVSRLAEPSESCARSKATEIPKFGCMVCIS
jgi:hypothetical protein